MPVEFKVLEAEFLPSLQIVLENSAVLLSEIDSLMSDTQLNFIKNIHFAAQRMKRTITDRDYLATIFTTISENDLIYRAFTAEFSNPLSMITHGSYWLIENTDNSMGDPLNSNQKALLAEIQCAGQEMEKSCTRLVARDQDNQSSS